MIEIGRPRRAQPGPPHVVFEALTAPDTDPDPPWLEVLDDERRPTIPRAEPPVGLVWSSLCTKRPDAAGNAPGPDDTLMEHLRRRMNQFINAGLRYTFGR